MNNTIDRIFDGIVSVLRNDVLLRLDDQAARGQVFAIIFMLNNLKLRMDWAVDPLWGQVQTQDSLFHELRALALDADLPALPRVPPLPLSGSDLLVLRDQGNTLICDLLAQLSGGALDAMGAPTTDRIRGVLQNYMRAEIDTEMRHTAKPMFAEMSSGKDK